MYSTRIHALHTLHLLYYACACCQINVILVSSGDITFPYSLRCPGFSSRDIARFIFTSEVSVVYKHAYMYLYRIYIYLCMQVSPADTYELLTTEWGVGHHLATALVERCGGHLYDIEHTLAWLAEDRELADALHSDYFSYVQGCLDSVEGDLAAAPEMVRMLTELARTGFCELRGIIDPVAALLSLHKVGSIVCKGSTIGGFDALRRPAWKSDFGLVPAQQSMRLVIAKELDSRGLLTSK